MPTIYVPINNHPQVKEFDLSSIRVCLSGAAPLPREVQERFQALTGCTLVEAYGLTETSPATHVNPIGRNKIGTIGMPWPDTDARIVDVDTGEQELPQGEIGELIIQGPQVMKGYWQQPTETANVLREHAELGPGLWLHTGDIARMDEEGYFQIVDRKKDMIICGGFNVYPRDIEEVLFKHPAVKEAAVVGIPDEYRGETVKAFVVLKEGRHATEEEIIAFCREHLAKYKVPSSVRVSVGAAQVDCRQSSAPRTGYENWMTLVRTWHKREPILPTAIAREGMMHRSDQLSAIVVASNIVASSQCIHADS